MFWTYVQGLTRLWESHIDEFEILEERLTSTGSWRVSTVNVMETISTYIYNYIKVS